MITILRATDRIAVPWKNGGGITREVAIWPPGSNFENFDWRVSIAEVREAGPFSRFENIDRTLMILQGRLALTFADKNLELGRDCASFAFPGEEACFGVPIEGTVLDLNVMTRRGRVIARATTLANETHSESGKTSLLVARSETNVRVGNRAFRLSPFDALWAAEPSVFSCDGEAFLIAIH